MFKGSLVALVTPMQEDGSLDVDSLRRLVDWHISQGTQGLVALGTTGEAATLSFDERRVVLHHVLDVAQKRVPVIAGTGHQSTTETIRLTQQAVQLGVQACLVVTPYYNKPTQEGLYLHYDAIAKESNVPLILYNVPSRTACDLLPSTTAQLAAHPSISGLKDATADISRVQQIRGRCNGALRLYSGDDATALAFLLAGGDGVISVTANMVPDKIQALCIACERDDTEQAEAIQQTLQPLHEQLFVQSNPIPIKWALATMGLIPPGIRLPLTPLSPRFHNTLQNVMQQLDLLEQKTWLDG